MSEAYRLETLLRLRRSEEDDAKAALGRGEAAVLEAEERVARAHAARDQSAARLHDARAQPGDGEPRRATELWQHELFVERLRLELSTSEDSVREMERAAAERRAEREGLRAKLLEAKRARETIEKHRARWADEQRRDAERREDLVQDELAARLPRDGETK